LALTGFIEVVLGLTLATASAWLLSGGLRKIDFYLGVTLCLFGIGSMLLAGIMQVTALFGV
jgi:hypothetical protein